MCGRRARPGGRARPASAPASSSSTSPPAPVGAEVEVTASTAYVDGRLHRFAVAARHTADGKVVASGEVTRVVVDAERFMTRVPDLGTGLPSDPLRDWSTIDSTRRSPWARPDASAAVAKKKAANHGKRPNA